MVSFNRGSTVLCSQEIKLNMENNYVCESRTSDDLYLTGEISNFSLFGLIAVSYVDYIIHVLCPLLIQWTLH